MVSTPEDSREATEARTCLLSEQGRFRSLLQNTPPWPKTTPILQALCSISPPTDPPPRPFTLSKHAPSSCKVLLLRFSLGTKFIRMCTARASTRPRRRVRHPSLSRSVALSSDSSRNCGCPYLSHDTLGYPHMYIREASEEICSNPLIELWLSPQWTQAAGAMCGSSWSGCLEVRSLYS